MKAAHHLVKACDEHRRELAISDHDATHVNVQLDLGTEPKQKMFAGLILLLVDVEPMFLVPPFPLTLSLQRLELVIVGGVVQYTVLKPGTADQQQRATRRPVLPPLNAYHGIHDPEVVL